MSAIIDTAEKLHQFIAARECPTAPRGRKNKQVWAVGSTVNVGFVRDLMIIGRDDDCWSLRDARGRCYVYSRSFGLERCAAAA